MEDDETLGDLLASAPPRPRLPVVVAHSAEAAITALAGGLRPDLVLLDINLPGETGWSVLRSDAFAAAGRPPVVVASAMAVSPARFREFGVAGYLPSRSRSTPCGRRIDRLLAEASADPMTDLQILLIAIGCVVAFAGYLLLCDRVGPMNVLEILTALTAAFVFVYLLWALLRPEDF